MAGNDPRSVVPHMRMDELLSALQVQLEAVLATRDRVRALIEAVVSVGGTLDLETVLHRIVEAAAALVGANYAALGVIGEGSTLIQFVPVGLSEQEIARIEHWPHGLGLLGALIKEPRTLRLEHMSQHRESSGFPSGHPPMESFLGVPIRVRDEVFGNLYLTEKRGGVEFDDEDEAIVVAFAAAAGVAIENARLYEESRRRETWLRAASEITTSLLSGADPYRVLALICRRAREMIKADVVAVLLPDEDRQVLGVVIADGVGADELDQAEVPVQGSLAGQAFLSGDHVMVSDLGRTELRSVLAEHVPVGPAGAVPLGAVGVARGVLAVGRVSGRSPFAETESCTLHAFAGQAAIALELAERRKEAERLELLEDRDRIAEDLHDVVIQRLSRTAMTLTGAVRLVDHPWAAGRIRSGIDELDRTIRQIGSTIFALEEMRSGSLSLRAQIVKLIEDAREQLGFAPGIELEGRLDALVPPQVGEHLLAVLREALSNMARHARAAKADVSVKVTETRLTLVVQDDGCGLGARRRRSGLRNLEQRAVQLGGSWEIGPVEPGGTRLIWSVPLA